MIDVHSPWHGQTNHHNQTAGEEPLHNIHIRTLHWKTQVRDFSFVVPWNNQKCFGVSSWCQNISVKVKTEASPLTAYSSPCLALLDQTYSKCWFLMKTIRELRVPFKCRNTKVWTKCVWAQTQKEDFGIKYTSLRDACLWRVLYYLLHECSPVCPQQWQRRAGSQSWCPQTETYNNKSIRRWFQVCPASTESLSLSVTPVVGEDKGGEQIKAPKDQLAIGVF